MQDPAFVAGLWHDVGKYQESFERYIGARPELSNENSSEVHSVLHSAAGAGLAIERYGPEDLRALFVALVYTVLDDLDESNLARLSADGFEACAIVETSAGNFQAWLKHASVLLSFSAPAARTLAARYGADPSVADWRRFGRLPGFTNCKPKYKQDNGLFPFVRLHSHSGQEFSPAQTFMEQITAAYKARELEREQRRAEKALSPEGERGRCPHLNGSGHPRNTPTGPPPRTSPSVSILFWHDEGSIGQALTDDYLSRDPSPSKRAAYIRRTMGKVRDWVARSGSDRIRHCQSASRL